MTECLNCGNEADISMLAVVQGLTQRGKDRLADTANKEFEVSFCIECVVLLEYIVEQGRKTETTQ